jgi:hypothetical protein
MAALHRRIHKKKLLPSQSRSRVQTMYQVWHRTNTHTHASQHASHTCSLTAPTTGIRATVGVCCCLETMQHTRRVIKSATVTAAPAATHSHDQDNLTGNPDSGEPLEIMDRGPTVHVFSHPDGSCDAVPNWLRRALRRGCGSLQHTHLPCP